MVKKVKNKEILIKIICLLLSFGLWIYINSTQNPVRERVITNIPVEILNTQALAAEGLALTPNQDVTVSLTISGPASEIYSINKSQFRVVASVLASGLKSGENTIPATVFNSPNGISIKNNYPSITINLENLEQKTMPIYSDVNVKNSAGTYVKDVKINPASASINGAQSLINQVSKLVVRGQLDNVNESTVSKLPIIAVNSEGQQVTGLTITPSQADASIDVEKGTSIPINIPTTGTLPSNLTLKSLTPNIKSIDVVGNGVQGLTSINTTPIDLSKITGSTTIPVTISMPEGVVNISGENSINVQVVVDSNSITKKIAVPIQLVGEKDGIQYKLEQDTAELTLSGNVSTINNLSLNNIVCNADVSNLTQTGSVNLVLANNNLSGVTISINPESVNVDVSQTEEKPPTNTETPPTNTEKPPTNTEAPPDNTTHNQETSPGETTEKPKPAASNKKATDNDNSNTNTTTNKSTTTKKT
ncbi:MAG: CdaR family protein [Sarcina sp.]